jgi:hypothetical protein
MVANRAMPTSMPMAVVAVGSGGANINLERHRPHPTDPTLGSDAPGLSPHEELTVVC